MDLTQEVSRCPIFVYRIPYLSTLTLNNNPFLKMGDINMLLHVSYKVSIKCNIHSLKGPEASLFLIHSAFLCLSIVHLPLTSD